MPLETEPAEVLASYPDDCWPWQSESLGSAGGLSGAVFWQLHTPRGKLCLRRWPQEHPSRERLEFIQAVLWHVDQEGFHPVSVPCETRRHAGYVQHAGHLWELGPWLPGEADYRHRPNPQRLQAAMRTLAEFHLAAANFPLPGPRDSPSPGMADRRGALQSLVKGEIQELAARIRPDPRPGFAELSRRLLELAPRLASELLRVVDAVGGRLVPLQPCIRDIWHDHVLFEGDQVAGLIDFGAMKAETVAADVARLLGSLVADDPCGWAIGLAAYEEVRRLSPAELELIPVFDRCGVLLGGINWVRWIYVEGRQFECPARIERRLGELVARAQRMAALGSRASIA